MMIVDPQVIVEPKLYHWRDGASRPLCLKEIRHLKLMKYSKGRRGRVLCKECSGVIANMAEGFNRKKTR